MLDPDMPTPFLALHMRELTAAEQRAARAAIRWANHEANRRIAELEATVSALRAPHMEAIATDSQWQEAHERIKKLEAEVARLTLAITRLRDCDWTISLPDRMDAVREIAREALLIPLTEATDD